jgi:hypothetical protein
MARPGVASLSAAGGLVLHTDPIPLRVAGITSLVVLRREGVKGIERHFLIQNSEFKMQNYWACASEYSVVKFTRKIRNVKKIILNSEF